MRPTGLTPLGEAREWVQEHRDDGVHCPCCDQYAKVYKRKLNATMVAALARLARASTEGFVHGPSVMTGGGRAVGAGAGELGKLAYFALVEEEKIVREDGGRAGYWRVTERGFAFLEGRAKVWKYAHVYDGQVVRRSGEAVGVQNVAPRFDYAELMAGV